MLLQDNTIQLEDLSVIKKLATGNFFTVHLVVHKLTGTLYALKSVSRDKIARYRLSHNVMTEKNLLLRIDHSGIEHLVKTFKDDDRVYFLCEYINGIELLEVIRKKTVVSNEQAQFYIGNLILALEHLAKMKIVHRNLKLENLIVDIEGYIAITGFGAAKIIKERTYTTVGTPHYVAPEIVAGKGYSFSCDVWSMGVILYELICFKVPFGNDCRDP